MITDPTPTAGTEAPPARKKQLPPLYVLTVEDSFDAPDNMRRVVLRFPEGTNFTYTRGQSMVLYMTLADGTQSKRDYTIREQLGADLISIDVLKHGATPGPTWAINAKAGETIEARGPRNKLAFNTEADWHLMAGDETCIPAFAHILEAAPAGAKVHLFLEVAGPEAQPVFTTAADLSVTWVDRQGATAGPSALMSDALAGFTFPQGIGQAYVIGETSNVRRQRQELIARGFDKAAILSEGYWRPGRIGGHDHIDD